MKAFFDFTDEQRTEWRENDITRAFLAQIRFERDQALANAASSTRSNDHHQATIYVGGKEAFDTMIRIAESEKK